MFYLFAYVNFMPNGYGPWQAAYDKLGEYVWKEEPSTLSYYFGIPYDYEHDFESTPLMFAWEVYPDRKGLYETHFNSPAMAEFQKAALPAMSTGFDLAHYAELPGGMLDAPGDARQCGVMQDIRIQCKSPEARTVAAARLAAVAAAVRARADPAVLTWMAFECLDDETGLRVFARFEDRAAMERANAWDEVVGFWTASKEKEIARIDQRAYVPNGKGWLHR